MKLPEDLEGLDTLGKDELLQVARHYFGDNFKVELLVVPDDFRIALRVLEKDFLISGVVGFDQFDFPLDTGKLLHILDSMLLKIHQKIEETIEHESESSGDGEASIRSIRRSRGWYQSCDW